MITSLYAGAAALGLILLSLRVIRLRRRYRISIGHQGNEEMERAIRVHGNFVEYTPFFLILLTLAELQGLPAAALHGAGACFLFARISHVFGLRSEAAPGVYRVLGMALTFAVIGGLGLALALRATGVLPA
jgi:uncharacterized protein